MATPKTSITNTVTAFFLRTYIKDVDDYIRFTKILGELKEPEKSIIVPVIQKALSRRHHKVITLAFALTAKPKSNEVKKLRIYEFMNRKHKANAEIEIKRLVGAA